MNTRHLLMASVLLGCGWLAFFGDKTPSTEISESVIKNDSARPASSASSTRTIRNEPAKNKENQEPVVLVLQSRDALIDRISPEPGSKKLFVAHSWTPPPPPPMPAHLPPSMAPPLPFKYLGKSKETDQWQIFLTRDSATFIVKENDVIENQYRVQQIDPPSMTLLYLPLNQTQSLTIE